MWYWLADVCVDETILFVLGHALAMKAIHGGKAKNDKIDTRGTRGVWLCSAHSHTHTGSPRVTPLRTAMNCSRLARREHHRRTGMRAPCENSGGIVRDRCSVTARLASAARGDSTTDAQGRTEAWVSGTQAEHERRRATPILQNGPDTKTLR